jgi:hypothetical protein
MHVYIKNLALGNRIVPKLIETKILGNRKVCFGGDEMHLSLKSIKAR